MNTFGKRMALLSSVVLLAGAGALGLGTTGCTTTRTVTFATNDVTGIVTGLTNVSKSVDPVRLDQVEAALEPLVAGGARRALKNSPQHSEEIAEYLRAVGQVFCNMQSSGQFDPEFLVRATDGIVSPMIKDDYVVDVKNAAVAIYKIAWQDRLKVDLPAMQWSGSVCKLVCNSIDRGLKDAGKPGVF